MPSTLATHAPVGEAGVLNSQQFMKQLMRAAGQVTAVSSTVVGMINLDRLKAINELYGRPAGDVVLGHSAQRLLASIGPYGHIGHLGGDVFGVLFHRGVDMNSASNMAQGFVDALGKKIEIEGKNIFTGASIGLSILAPDQDAAETLRQANKALYLAKEKGRGRFVIYSPEFEKSAGERVEIEADLRSAIENSAIEPWFQPIVALDDMRLLGFEVLARWEHTNNWWVPPQRFIETAEHCGLIDQLSLDLFQKACNAAQNWDEDLSISFNISPHQFNDADLTSNLKRVLLESSLDPSRLTLEITESAVIQEVTSARSKLKILKDIGIQIALDDFGSGFSSLSNLGHLPIDRIKIDRTFISNIAASPHNQKIVKGILSLAAGLDIEVTAEGIETAEDLNFLRAHNCRLGQGYLFQRALPAPKVDRFLKTKWTDRLMSTNNFVTMKGVTAAPMQVVRGNLS